MLRKLGIDGERQHNERGVALVELALLLPLLVVLAFGVIDLGRLIHARLVVTNVSREGGSLASRDIQTGNDLITMLQSSATPFNLADPGPDLCHQDQGRRDEVRPPSLYRQQSLGRGLYA